VQIIIVDRRWAQARTLNVSQRTLLLGGLGLLCGVLLAATILYAVTFRVGTEFRVPILHDIISFTMREEVERNNQYARENVAAMARKLGEMQAQLMRLDALGQRMSKVAGISPEEFNFNELPGRGGVLGSDARPMTSEELDAHIAEAAHSVAQRADYLDIIESELLSDTVRNALLPQGTPVSQGFIGSGFGMRADPFTGRYAMHEGVDFAAPEGTPIFAAAGGVVVTAEKHQGYGNMVKIDHGNGLATLYGHASRLYVKVGDLIKRGQTIAAVGSTGRSTGPHLHFEVHVNGQPKNPAKYLADVKPGSPLADLTERKRQSSNKKARQEKSVVTARIKDRSPGKKPLIAHTEESAVHNEIDKPVNAKEAASAKDLTAVGASAARSEALDPKRAEPNALLAPEPQSAVAASVQ